MMCESLKESFGEGTKGMTTNLTKMVNYTGVQETMYSALCILSVMTISFLALLNWQQKDGSCESQKELREKIYGWQTDYFTRTKSFLLLLMYRFGLYFPLCILASARQRFFYVLKIVAMVTIAFIVLSIRSRQYQRYVREKAEKWRKFHISYLKSIVKARGLEAKKLSIEPQMTCAICVDVIMSEEKAVDLSCSKNHVYHV